MTKCSRSGCEAAATHKLEWRNPKIHDETRVKVWASCHEHREFLIDYLQSRGLFLQAQPFDAKDA